MRSKTLLFVLSLVLSLNVLAQPANWMIDTPSPGDLTLMPNTVDFTQGVQSCEMMLHTTNVPYFVSDNFAVNAGANYTFSVDVYDNDTRGRLKVYADFYDADGGDIYGEAPLYSEDMDAWQTISWSALVPEGAVEGYVWIKFYDQDDFIDEAIILVDNTMFVEDGGENLVANGGYEAWTMLGMYNAYYVGEGAVDVRYNSAIEAVSPADFMMSGTADITFANAEIDANDPTLVHLSGASQSLDFDLTIDELSQTGLEGTSMVSLYAGMATIAYTNTANPDGVLENDISATFQGIISAHDAYNNVWVHDGAGAYMGVMIFGYSFQEEVAVGDEVMFTAKRDDYFDLSELVSPILLQTISTGNTPYQASNIAGADINTSLPAGSESAEKWEGQLVTVSNAVVIEYNEEDFYYLCTDDDGTTQIKIGDNVDFQLANVSLSVDDVYQIIGVVDFSYGEYRLNPRGADDIKITTGISNPSASALKVYPNPAKESIHISCGDVINNISISNINGSLIKKSFIGNNSTSFDVSGLPAGIYVLRLETTNETLSHRLVIR